MHEIFRNVQACLEALAPGPIHAVAVTNQRETTVCWDRASGRALCRAVVWSDVRAEALVEVVQAELEAMGIDFRVVTGLALSPNFSGFKMRWMIENIPEIKVAVQNKTCCFGTIDSYIVFRLTQYGNICVADTDAANDIPEQNILVQ